MAIRRPHACSKNQRRTEFLLVHSCHVISFHAFRLVNRTENPMTQEQLVSSEKDLIFTDQVITYKISLDSIQYAPNHESLDFF